MKKPGTTNGKKRTVARDLSVSRSKARAVTGGEVHDPITQAPSQPHDPMGPCRRVRGRCVQLPNATASIQLETNCVAAVHGRHTLSVSLPPVRDGESGRKSSVSQHTHQASVEDAEKGEHE